MKVLLDTHALLWLINDDPKLSATARAAFLEPDVAQLPFVHRDPFDRLLVAQAKYEHMTMPTVDPQFARYGIAVCW